MHKINVMLSSRPELLSEVNRNLIERPSDMIVTEEYLYINQIHTEPVLKNLLSNGFLVPSGIPRCKFPSDGHHTPTAR